MSLTFGGATSNRVEHGSAASLDNLNTWTVAMWIRPTTWTLNRAIFSKTGATLHKLVLCGSSGFPGDLQVVVNRVTTLTNYTTSNTPITSGVWQYVAFTFSTATSPSVAMYRGSLTAIAAACTFASPAVGSGALISDAADNFKTGNDNSNASSFQGDIAWIGQWNRVLTAGEIQDQQFNPHVTSGCVMFTHYGYNGTSTQPDWSGNGNSGTVTGATQAAHVPLNSPFGVTNGWFGNFVATVAAFSGRLFVAPAIRPVSGTRLDADTRLSAGTRLFVQ